jgi:hypothetical protein
VFFIARYENNQQRLDVRKWMGRRRLRRRGVSWFRDEGWVKMKNRG